MIIPGQVFRLPLAYCGVGCIRAISIWCVCAIIKQFPFQIRIMQTITYTLGLYKDTGVLCEGSTAFHCFHVLPATITGSNVWALKAFKNVYFTKKILCYTCPSNNNFWHRDLAFDNRITLVHISPLITGVANHGTWMLSGADHILSDWH